MFGPSEDFGPYGPKHGLAIVDMHERDLFDGGQNQAHVRKLIHNIQKSAQECIQRGGPVVLIEFARRGGTLSSIRDTIQTCGREPTILQKNSWGLFTENDQNRQKQKEYFSSARDNGTRFTLGGVNTSVCCLDVAVSLLKYQIGVRIRAGITLNIGSRSYNEFTSVSGFFKKYPWLLSLPRNPGKEESLLDYL